MLCDGNPTFMTCGGVSFKFIKFALRDLFQKGDHQRWEIHEFIMLVASFTYIHTQTQDAHCKKGHIFLFNFLLVFIKREGSQNSIYNTYFFYANLIYAHMRMMSLFVFSPLMMIRLNLNMPKQNDKYLEYSRVATQKT